MTEEEKSEYKKITGELHQIAARLQSLSDAGFSDMEGADLPEFAISECLYCLDSPSISIKGLANAIERLLAGDDPSTL